MSYLLESLGRGLITRLRDVFAPALRVHGTRRELAERAAACPTSVDALCQLGNAALRDNLPGPAQRSFRAAHELDSEAAAPRIGLACVQDELGNLGEALRWSRQVADHDPGDAAAAFAVALCHERRRDICSARTWYELALERCDSLRNARERLAAIAIRRGNWQAAAEQYERLADLDPDDLDVLLLRGGLELRAGNPAAAVELFQQALLIEPELHDERLLDEPLPDDEVELWRITQQTELLVARFPGASEFRVQLGDLYARQGEDRRAVEQYESALDLQPTFLEATVKLGTQHMRASRFLEAARSFNAACELNDRLLIAFVGLGLAQQAAGEELEAEATFDLAASLAPNSMLLHAEALRLRLRADQPEQDGAVALERARQALGRQGRLRPDDAGLHYRLAMIERHLGQRRSGQRHFARAVELHPSFCKAALQHGLGLRQSDENGAQALLGSALHLPDAIVADHYELGLLFAQPVRFELALRGIRDNDPDGATAEESLILSLQNIGLLDRAEGTWRSVDAIASAQAATDRVRG